MVSLLSSVFLHLTFEGSDHVCVGSEEDLDEEGLGRRAVTAQVPASVRGVLTLRPAPRLIMTDGFPPLTLLPGEGVRQTGS